MDAYSQLLLQVYYEEILTPIILSFALVIFLICTVKKVEGVSPWKIYVMFTIGFVSIIFWPHVWLIFYPEPCIQTSGPPTQSCQFSPWVRVKLGLFFGAFGCLLALFSLKAWQFLARKMMGPNRNTPL